MKRLLVLAIVCAGGVAQASHFRYAHVWWQRLSGNVVRFTIVDAWRADYSNQNIEALSLSFGDGGVSDTPGTIIGTFFDPVTGDRFEVHNRTVDRQYAGSGPYLAVAEGGERVSTLQNAPDQNYRIETVVDLRNPLNSISPKLAWTDDVGTVLKVPIGGPAAFTLALEDPDQAPFTCRMSTASEAGLLPGTPWPTIGGQTLGAGPGCVVTWDTSGATEADIGKRYAAQVMVSSIFPNDTTRVAIDFMVELVPPRQAAPTCAGPSGVQTLVAGRPFSFTFTGGDAVAGTQLFLFQSGLPVFARMDPSVAPAPLGATITGQPSAADVGQTGTVTVAYADPTLLTGACSMPYVVVADQPPVVTLDALPPYTNSRELHITGTVTDDFGLTRVWLRVDNVDYVIAADAGGHVDGRVTVSSDGRHNVQIGAVDSGGQTRLSGLATIIVDTEAPYVDMGTLPRYTSQTSLNVVYFGNDLNCIADLVLTVNGAPVSLPPTVACLPQGTATIPLERGLNTLVLTAHDRAGNVAARVADVFVQDVPPDVAILAPSAGQAIGTATTPVQVVFSSPIPTTVTMQGQTLATAAGTGVAASGTWSFAADGPATITVTAVDAAGNVATASVAVFVDELAPELSLAAAGGGPLAAAYGPRPGDLLPVNLRVDEARSAVTVTNDFGAPVNEVGRDEGGALLAYAVPLHEGTNLFGFTATSEVGRTASLQASVVYDVTPPVVSFVVPAAEQAARGELELAIDASDNLTGWSVRYEVDGAPLLGALLDTTALGDGPHAVTAVVVDGVGNVTRASRDVVIDNAAPAVALIAPGDGAAVGGVVEVTAEASDATSGVGSIVLSVNGAPLASCSASPCTAAVDTSAFLDGPFNVTALATDGAGNSATAQLQPVADNSAPAHFLLSPTQGATVSGSVTVTVAVVDPGFASVSCTVGAQALGVSTSPSFTQVVSLAGHLDGPVLVRCTAVDTAGNAGVEQATVYLRTWTVSVSPQTLHLRHGSGSGPVTVFVEGASVASLLPVASHAVTLRVAGGAPVPALDVAASAQAGDSNGNGVPDVTLKVERRSLLDSLRSGIAAGAIDGSQPVPVRLYTGGTDVGGDTVRVME